MKIELDGQRYYTLDEATEMIGTLKSSTVLKYAYDLEKKVKRSVVTIGQKALLSEQATISLLEQQQLMEQKRKARMVTVGGVTYDTKSAAAKALGVDNSYITGWLKVNEILNKQHEVKNEPKIEQVVVTPQEPEEVVEPPKTVKGKTLPYKDKKVLIVGGSQFYARWRTFLKKQGIQLVTYDSKKGVVNVDTLRSVMRNADYVLIAQNATNHATYQHTKKLAKETDTPCINFTSWGNKTLIRALDELTKQQNNK